MRLTRTEARGPRLDHEEDIQPREPWPPALGWRSSWDRCRPVQLGLRRVLHDEVYHLPRWQRGQVWVPGQQVAFCEAVWSGLPVAPLLVWTRRVGETDVAVLLDGQQRLCALGAQVLLADGSAVAPTAALLDVETGRWGTTPSPDWPPITMSDAADGGRMWLRKHRPQLSNHLAARLQMLLLLAAQRLEGVDIVAYVMGASVAAIEAQAIFRSWNRPGTPLTEEEIDSLIKRADLGPSS